DLDFSTFERRTVNSERYYALVAEVIAGKSNDEWLRLLDSAEIPCIRLNSTEELYSDPHLCAAGFFHEHQGRAGETLVLPRFPVEFSKSPARMPGDAPRLSEHAREVLHG